MNIIVTFVLANKSQPEFSLAGDDFPALPIKRMHNNIIVNSADANCLAESSELEKQDQQDAFQQVRLFLVKVINDCVANITVVGIRTT